MGKLISASLLVALCALGCSKKGGASVAEETSAPPPQAPKADQAVVNASIDDIGKKLEAQQYDAAVGAMTAMAPMPKTPQQQAEFMRQVRLAQQALAQRAAQGDPNAQQSQMMLGRMMTGR